MLKIKLSFHGFRSPEKLFRERQMSRMSFVGNTFLAVITKLEELNLGRCWRPFSSDQGSLKEGSVVKALAVNQSM